MPHPILYATIALALVYAFMNGYNDSGATIAPMVASRAIDRRPALILAAIAEFCGPFLFGVAVAASIGTSVVHVGVVSSLELLVAVMTAVAWGLLANWLRVPTSASHALLGGLVGAVGAVHGVEALNFWGIARIVLFLFLTPLVGLVLGHLTLSLVLHAVRGATPSVNQRFRYGEIIWSLLLALSHGTNDGQKSIGVITLALIAAGALPAFEVPGWVILACALAIALGVAFGSQRIMWRVGAHLYRIRPIHGFAATSASFFTLLVATLAGAPVSGTQIVSATLAGAGAAQRVSMVRWTVFQSMAMAWIVTGPATTIVAAVLALVLRRLGWG
ncbi:MAG: inorganic phosphate transporter [Anaerolineae bacterium]|nr:inorganic phosphate transporter [Anaerolineae bacterium]